MKLIVSDPAQADLDGIWDYIADDDPEAADKFLEKIWKVINDLRLFPESGRARFDLRVGLRLCPVDNYLVLYEVAADEVRVVRIIHGARRLGPLLGGD